MKKLLASFVMGLGLLGASALALAQSAPAPAPAPIHLLDSGDTAWMLTSTLLVVLMVIPGLALVDAFKNLSLENGRFRYD